MWHKVYFQQSVVSTFRYCGTGQNGIDYPEIQQPLSEWSNWSGLELSILETDVYIWHYTLLVVHARKGVVNGHTLYVPDLALSACIGYPSWRNS